MQSPPTTLAWVGAGHMAREHLRAFCGLPGVVPAGIHSRTTAKASALATEFSLPHVAPSIQALYEQTHANLVIVAVPELAARQVAQECFRLPWAVLLEKPPGFNLPDAQAILDAAQSAQHPVYVALNRRFLASTQSAWADLQSSPEPRFIHAADQQSLQTAAAVGHPPEVVRHWMFANSIHVIDLLRRFGRGPVSHVHRIAPWNPHQPGVVLAHVQFESGDSGLYEGIWNGPGPWAVSVTTATKRWELRPLEQAGFQTPSERRLHPLPPDPLDQAFKPGFRRQAEEVLAALHGKPSQAVTLAEAFSTMQLIQVLFGL